MLAQHWTLEVIASQWLGKLRILCVAFFVLCAAYLCALAVGVVGVSGWWGDWLWPWPLLMYLSWVVGKGPAPLLDAPTELVLTESGELGQDYICHSLATPWLIALQLAPQHNATATSREYKKHKRWVWVLRDQLSTPSWTRLKRVCRSIALHPESGIE